MCVSDSERRQCCLLLRCAAASSVSWHFLMLFQPLNCKALVRQINADSNTSHLTHCTVTVS